MASAAGSVIKSGVKQVKPLLSVDNAEARKRVLQLYKAWYRQVPYIGTYNLNIYKNIHVFFNSCLQTSSFKQFWNTISQRIKNNAEQN